MATLDGTAISRNPRTEVPCVNLSPSVTINAGDVLALDATNTEAVQLAANPGQVGKAVIQCAAGGQPVGVAIADMPPGFQGAMQLTGFIQVINSAAGAIAVGAVVIPDTAGQVKTAAGNVPGVGIAWSAGAAQGDLIDLQLIISFKT
jgi:predicted RecA/RadA family phage recombinase